MKIHRKNFKNDLRDVFKQETNVLKPLCPICQHIIESSDDMEIGHIVSVFNYGTNDISNLVALHKWCNIGTHSIQQYLDNLSDDLKTRVLRLKKQ